MCSGCFHRITAIVAYGVIYLVVVLSECGCSLLPEFVAKSRNSRRGKGPVFWPSKEKQRILCKNLVAAVGLEPDVFPKDRHLDPTTCSRMMSLNRAGCGHLALKRQRIWQRIGLVVQPDVPGGVTRATVTDQSSPSRVRYAAKLAPLTAPGRSGLSPLLKERGALRKTISKSHLTDTGTLTEGDSAAIRLRPGERRSPGAVPRGRSATSSG